MKYLRFVGITDCQHAGLVFKILPVFGIAGHVFNNETAYEVGYDVTSKKYEFRVPCDFEGKLLEKAYGLVYSTFLCVENLNDKLPQQVNNFLKLLEEENETNK